MTPKHSWLVAGIATCLLVAACAPSLPKGRITLITQINFTTEPYRGTFDVTKGAEVLGCERGSFVDTPAGTTILKEFTCESGERSGTFTAKFNPQDAPGPGDRNGPWSIVEAADDFSGLEGGGEFWVVFDEEGKTGVETLTGDIQFSPDAVKANSIRRGTGEQSKPKQSDPPPALTPKAWLELRLVGSGPGPGLSEMRDLGPSQPVFVSNIPVITNADIAYARATRYADAPAVEITFTKTGEIKFCDITSANIGKSMAVLVDGKLVNVATIRERFCGGTGGKAIITGNFSIEEAKRIAATFPDGPANAVKVNSVWQGTGYQSKPALAYAAEAPAVRNLETLLAPIREKHRLPALGCAVVQSNGMVALGVVGVRNQGMSEPVTSTDKWHHGSLTKSMTATLAAMMVGEGKLAWQTKLTEVFPEKAKAMHSGWRDVTLEQLLSHRSGTPEDLEPGGIWGRLWDFSGTPREARLLLVDLVTARPPHHPPGTHYEYSNAGYAIAGAMLEKLAGTPWEELITERLFRPLGMTSAGFGVPATPRYVNQPWGHILKDDTVTPVAPGIDADNPPSIGPAGTVHASLPDMARYLGFHLAGARGEGTLLDPAGFEKLHTDVAGQGYGLGWSIIERGWADGKALHHLGSNTMWFTNVWIAPKRNWAIIIVTNYGGEGGFEATDAVAARLVREYLE